MTIEEAWNELMEMGVSEDALRLVSAINGYSLDTMEAILYAHTGYRSFDQVSE